MIAGIAENYCSGGTGSAQEVGAGAQGAGAGAQDDVFREVLPSVEGVPGECQALLQGGN